MAGILQTISMTSSQGINEPRRLCETLSLEESDDIFFPNIPGKKPTRAKALCATCPFELACLQEALLFDLDGNYSGTTKKERRAMARLNKVIQLKLDEFMPVVEEPTAARPKYLHIVAPPDHHEWMDEVEPDDAEIFALDQAV